jgi:hypothetical protein
LRIAQHFSAGLQTRKKIKAREVGDSSIEMMSLVCRPKLIAHPALKRWAIIGRALRGLKG